MQRLLAEIDGVLYGLSNDDIIIFGGDFNVDLRCSNEISNLFHCFMNNHKLSLLDFCFGDVNYSFINSTMSHNSLIDYFAVSHIAVLNASDKLEILEIEPNCSDHLPVKLTLFSDFVYNQLYITNPGVAVSVPHSPVIRQLRWDHGDCLAYYNYTRDGLYPVLQALNFFTRNMLWAQMVLSLTLLYILRHLL